MKKLIVAITVTGIVLTTNIACKQRSTNIENADARKMVELLMPQRVEIVEAFTAFRSFDDDNIPDGIELLIQPVDSFGDPVKVAGTLRVELYAFKQASGQKAGERICDPWEITLLSETDQKTYWNPITGMYEAKLHFPPDIASGLKIPESKKFLLSVTYNTPLSKHMTSECVLKAPQNLQ